MNKNYKVRYNFLFLSYTLINFLTSTNGQSSVTNFIEPFSNLCKSKNGLWFTSEKSYFIGNFIKVNWFKANLHCKALGMELLSIETESENELLRNMLSENKEIEKEYFWTSGSDLGQEGAWNWYGTGRAFTYTNWSKDQPDNVPPKEHCMHLWAAVEASDVKKWSWNDYVCTLEFYFICEK